MSNHRFDGQVAIITGAGAGMGREHALLLARLGASVVVNDISENAETVVQEITDAGGQAIVSHHDVSDPDATVDLVHAAVAKFGGLHILVSNAGIIKNVPFTEMDFEAFDKIMKVNAYGAFNLVRASWGTFVQQKYGRIIVVSSSSAWTSQPLIAHYAASKGAVLGLTKTLAVEGAEHGITANVLAPGAFTAMSGQMTDERARRQAELMMSPALVSPAIAWLAHRDNTHNGQIFEAAAGRVGLNFIGSTRGYWNQDLTIDDLFEHDAEITNRSDYAVLTDTTVLSEWMTLRTTGWADIINGKQ